MTHIFYIFGIAVLFSELRWILNPMEKTEASKKFKELSDLHKGKDWDGYSKEYKDLIKSKFYILLIFTWLFIGLFTFQWPIFLLILIFNTIVIAPVSKLTKFNIMFAIIHWVNSLLGFAFVVFVIVNKYHLHINVYEVVKQSILK